MECKWNRPASFPMLSPWINRYIMECKFVIAGWIKKDWGINRYIMECKFGRGRIQTNLWRELIDTLWNVNVDAAGVLSEYDKELIDTLWNVNI